MIELNSMRKLDSYQIREGQLWQYGANKDYLLIIRVEPHGYSYIPLSKQKGTRANYNTGNPSDRKRVA
jgi:hypothetical protein